MRGGLCSEDSKADFGTSAWLSDQKEWSEAICDSDIIGESIEKVRKDSRVVWKYFCGHRGDTGTEVSENGSYSNIDSF